jgi:Ca2+-binding EF-hand superfamily protein
MNALRAFVLVLALAAAAPAFAQAAKPQPQPQPQPASNEIDALFAAWDADHNRVLSQQEFRGGWNTLRQQAESRVEARLRDQFDKVDGNHDGAIDAGEYGNLLLVRQAGKSAPQLPAFDANHDQRLQFGEYLSLVGSMAAPAARAKAKP